MWLTVEMLSERGYSPSLAKGMACSFLELQTLLILRSKEDLLVSCVLPPGKNAGFTASPLTFALVRGRSLSCRGTLFPQASLSTLMGTLRRGAHR